MATNPTIIISDSDLRLRDQITAEVEKLRPIFWSEGGDAKVLGVNEGVARVRFGGGCAGCGGGMQAMVPGFRLMLLERIGGLKDVIFE